MEGRTMNSTLVHTTSTDAHRRHATATAGITRVHAATHAPLRIRRTFGLCTGCGSVEVELDRVTGTRDLSSIGESATYPVGYGCAVCS
jgi:hypothetical protein